MCKVIALLLLALLSLPSKASAQIANIAVSEGTCVTCASLAYSHTVTTASNRGIIVGAAMGEAGPTFTGVTYATVSMTEQSEATCIATFCHAALYTCSGAICTATGTNSVVVSSSVTDNITSGAISGSNVNQTSPFGAVVTNTGETCNPCPSLNIATATNDLAVGTWARDGGCDTLDHFTAGTGETEWWDVGEGCGGGGGSYETATGSTTTIAPTADAGGNFVGIGIAMKVLVVASGCDHILAESGDRIAAENNDVMLTESSDPSSCAAGTGGGSRMLMGVGL